MNKLKGLIQKPSGNPDKSPKATAAPEPEDFSLKILATQGRVDDAHKEYVRLSEAAQKPITNVLMHSMLDSELRKLRCSVQCIDTCGDADLTLQCNAMLAGVDELLAKITKIMETSVEESEKALVQLKQETKTIGAKLRKCKSEKERNYEMQSELFELNAVLDKISCYGIRKLEQDHDKIRKKVAGMLSELQEKDAKHKEVEQETLRLNFITSKKQVLEDFETKVQAFSGTEQDRNTLNRELQAHCQELQKKKDEANINKKYRDRLNKLCDKLNTLCEDLKRKPVRASSEIDKRISDARRRIDHYREVVHFFSGTFEERNTLKAALLDIHNFVQQSEGHHLNDDKIVNELGAMREEITSLVEQLMKKTVLPTPVLIPEISPEESVSDKGNGDATSKEIELARKVYEMQQQQKEKSEPKPEQARARRPSNNIDELVCALRMELTGNNNENKNVPEKKPMLSPQVMSEMSVEKMTAIEKRVYNAEHRVEYFSESVQIFNGTPSEQRVLRKNILEFYDSVEVIEEQFAVTPEQSKRLEALRNKLSKLVEELLKKPTKKENAETSTSLSNSFNLSLHDESSLSNNTTTNSILDDILF